jgi:hypothetical protein
MGFDPKLQLQHLVVAVILACDEQEIGTLRLRMTVHRQRFRRRDREIVSREAIDHVDGEVEIGGGRTGADHPVIIDEALVERERYRRVALLEQGAEGRVGGDAPAVEYSCLSKKKCAGAGRSQQRLIFRE